MTLRYMMIMRESSLSKLAYVLAFLSGIDNWLLIQSLVESCRDWTDEYFMLISSP